MTLNDNSENIIAAFADDEVDKYSLLEKVIEQARFFEILDEAQRESGKPKGEFKIAIKPNLSMLLRRNDVGTYTDPFLVIHLLRLLIKNGYTNIILVESQNLYGNWFGHRSVIEVAARAGYLDETIIETYCSEKEQNIHVSGEGVDALVPIMDLTMDRTKYDFGEPLGEVELGKSWIDADFRVSFAKMKTHFYSYYTAVIKNVYGCLPEQDKVRGYHCRRAVGPWTAQLVKNFPVHFSILDAYSAADGWVGVKMKAISSKPHTIIAGADILAVDHYTAKLMGVDPEKSIMYSNLEQLMPARPYKVAGNAQPFKPWRKSPHLIAQLSMKMDPHADIMDLAGSLATGGHDECFPVTLHEGKLFRKLLYYLTLPINYLVDAGYIKLKLRKMLFVRKLKQHKQHIPEIANSGFIMERLTLLTRSEIERLIDLLVKNNGKNVRYSGHYFINGSNEFAMPARLSTTNIAVMDILNHVERNNMDREVIAKEINSLPTLIPRYFGNGNTYPYCYR